MFNAFDLLSACPGKVDTGFPKRTCANVSRIYRMSNMTPVLAVAAMWALFIATHMGLATSRIRGALVARLGERGFLVLYSLVAAMTFAALVATYVAVRDGGPAGLALAPYPFARGALVGAIAAGFVLMIGVFSP